MKHGIQKWLPTFQKIEKEVTDRFKVLKKAHDGFLNTLQRYGGEPTKEVSMAKQLMDTVLVTCSEGLLLRALAYENPETRRNEVRLHMQRMMDQKVKQVAEPLLAACQKTLAS